MDRAQQQSERIEDFVMGRMSSAEAEAFRVEIERDAELKEQVGLHFLMKEALGNEDAYAFREQVSAVIREERGGTVKRGAGRPAWWLAAAILIAFAGFMAWFLIGEKHSPESLFEAYYEPYPVYQISRSDDHSPGLQEAMEYYGLGRYAEASDLLSGLRDTDLENRDLIDFYTGISFIERRDLGRAEQLLRAVDDRNTVLYDQQARWYLALVLLKQDRIPEVIALLNELETEPGRIGKDAAALARTLEN